MKRLTLREAREVRGLTQVELAAAASMTQHAISNLEVGTTKQATPQTMARLSRVLKMDAVFSLDGLRFEERPSKATREVTIKAIKPVKKASEA